MHTEEGVGVGGIGVEKVDGAFGAVAGAFPLFFVGVFGGDVEGVVIAFRGGGAGFWRIRRGFSCVVWEVWVAGGLPITATESGSSKPVR